MSSNQTSDSDIEPTDQTIPSNLTVPLSFFSGLDPISQNLSFPEINIPQDGMINPTSLLNLLMPNLSSLQPAPMGAMGGFFTIPRNTQPTATSNATNTLPDNRTSTNSSTDTTPIPTRRIVTRQPNINQTSTNAPVTTQRETIINDDMKYCDDRLDSFAYWPPHHHVTAYDLARAGFYYTGSGDVVKCHSCGLIICNMKAGDNPIDEHLRWNPTCEFMKMTYCHNTAPINHSYRDATTNATVLRLLESNL